MSGVEEVPPPPLGEGSSESVPQETNDVKEIVEERDGDKGSLTTSSDTDSWTLLDHEDEEPKDIKEVLKGPFIALQKISTVFDNIQEPKTSW